MLAYVQLNRNEKAFFCPFFTPYVSLKHKLIMENVQITCTFCKIVLFCPQKSIRRVRNGHLTYCAQYKQYKAAPKKRALEPEDVVIYDNFNFSKQAKEANENDFYYDIADWEELDADVEDALQGELSTKYEKAYGSIK